MFGYRIAEADEVGQCEKLTVCFMGERSTKKHEFFGNMLILEMTFFEVIFWRSYIYIYIYVLGVIFFEITVYFLGDLFLGSFFSPITWIYPAPQPSWVLSV